MIRSTLSRVLTIAATAILAGPAFSQTAEGTSEADAQPQDVQIGQTYIREAISDWNIRCIRGEGARAEDTCQLYQLLVDASENPISEFTLLPAPEESDVAALITVITPLETVLTEGLILAIDDVALPPRPFIWCNQTGCFSRFGVSQEEVESMKRGAVATVSIVALAAPQRRIEVTASLRGFTAAFDKLRAEQQAAQQ